MLSVLRLVAVMVIVFYPFLLNADEYALRVVKKPQGLKKSDPNKDPELTIHERL